MTRNGTLYLVLSPEEDDGKRHVLAFNSLDKAIRYVNNAWGYTIFKLAGEGTQPSVDRAEGTEDKE